MKKLYSLGAWILILTGLIFACQRADKKSAEEKLMQERIRQTGRRLKAENPTAIWEIRLRRNDGNYILYGFTDSPQTKKELLKFFDERQLSVRDSISLLPLAQWKNIYGVVRLSAADVRAFPSHKSELTTQVLMGMPVEILQEKNNFYRIRTPSGYTGWMPASGLQIMNSEVFEQWLSRPKLIVEVPRTAVRSAPDPGSPQIKEAVMNDVMIFLREGEYYHRVLLPDGRQGYVSASDVNTLDEWHFINSKLFSINDFLTHLELFYPGIPYMWGGTSVKAMDCSGFVKNVFHNFGILLPRDAYMQFTAGKEVPVTPDLQYFKPGDLIFFGPEKADESTKRITHVAVYAGNGKIMHASGEVKTESLVPGDSLYNAGLRKRMRGARRIFGYYNKEIYPYYTVDALEIFHNRQR